MAVHLFGIRHHGPGSTRSLVQALTALEPDILLVEGPAEAESVLPLLTHGQMQPPVALLLYAPDNLHQAVYYPMTVFSPEWQAIHYGLTHQIPVRFMDLPQAHRFALEQPAAEETPPTPPVPRIDPLTLLAQAAGYSDGERWWEHLVEQRRDSTELFEAILTAMTVLRAEAGEDRDPLEPLREAYMRQTIRQTEKQGFQEIAVVCGAWHTPALAQLPPAQADQARLKGLPKVKVAATWIPWTYERLTFASGYRAGITSPGWYQHLWEQSQAGGSAQESSVRWMARVAHLLRQQDLDASSANVIEAVRLAETLAALRDRTLPGLPELNEATQTVLCFGDPLPMRLIHEQLIVSDRLGSVPEETPAVPLQQDLQRQQKRLRLKVSATATTLELDLRKPLDLERSHLFHRLILLNLDWGQFHSTGGGKGTFRETWVLAWKPELAIRLIEMGIWGNTVELAATAWTCDRAHHANLPDLTELIDQTLLANLPAAIAQLTARLEVEAAQSTDLTHLMAALPPLVNVMRYGTVRQIETDVVGQVVQGLVTRICIGLPVAAASLDDDAAAALDQLVVAVQGAIALLQQPDLLAQWQKVLVQLADQQGLHGLLAGRCCRLLFDAGQFAVEEMTRRLSFALSTATEPAQAAAWIEGFLAGSGLLLLHNSVLWQVLDQWVITLSADTFTTVLPLLRRTFATFAAPERRQMGERVRRGDGVSQEVAQQHGFDRDRADTVLPLIRQLLGLMP